MPQNKIINMSLFIDIAAILVFAFFTILNFSLNKSPAILVNAVTYSSLLILAALILKSLIKSQQLILFLISAASLCVGITYGGIFGIAGVVSVWPLLMAMSLKVPKSMGIVATCAVFLILCLYGFAAAKFAANNNVTIASYQWAGALIVLFTIYAVVKIFYEYFSHEKSPIQVNAIVHQTAQTAEDIETKQPSSQTEFIAEMSHEIRTPLNAIMGFTDTMQEEVFGPLDGKYKEYLGYIQQSGHHLLDLVGDILDMSKIEAGKYKLSFGEYDMVSIINDVIKIMQEHAKRANVKLNFFGHGSIITYCDERSVRQIALNLLSNAIKFTPEGGEIDVGVYSNDEKVWIEVKDSGRGMSDEELKQIGQPYISGSDIPKNIRSTGLGLSLVRKLVDFHNGVFIIKSKLGSGTRVIIELPRYGNKN